MKENKGAGWAFSTVDLVAGGHGLGKVHLKALCFNLFLLRAQCVSVWRRIMKSFPGAVKST